MRGAGGTPRGFRAHQNNLRRGRRTNKIRRTAPNRQTRQRKAARSNKPIFFQAPMPLRPADPPRSPPCQPRSRPTPDATKKSNNFHPKSPTSKSDHSNHPNGNKTTGEQPTDSQKGSQIKRLKGGDKFPTSYSEEGKETTVEFKG